MTVLRSGGRITVMKLLRTKFKILIPVNRCNHYVVGCQEAGLGEYIRLVCEKVDSMLS